MKKTKLTDKIVYWFWTAFYGIICGLIAYCAWDIRRLNYEEAYHLKWIHSILLSRGGSL